MAKKIKSERAAVPADLEQKPTEGLLTRHINLRADDIGDDGEIRVIASTDAPVSFGGYREVLAHKPGSVDYSSAKSVLLNHDRNQIIGGVKSIEMKEGQLVARLSIADSAKTMSGTSIRDLVKTGALQGVSIGYNYDRDSADYDENSNTITARKWSLREITLTPTQADVNAQVTRSLPDFIKPAAPAAEQKERSVSDDKKAPQADQAAAHDEKVRADEVKSLRAEVEAMKRADAIRTLAASYKVEMSDAEIRGFGSIDAGKDEIMKRMAAERANKPEQPVISFGQSSGEKANDAAVASLLSLGGVRDDSTKNAEHGSFLEIVRRHAERSGKRTSDWNRSDLAAYALSKPVEGMRADPANVTSSNFNTVVLGLYVSKQVFNGFNAFGASTTYQQWTARRVVPDFKTFASGTIETGNLTLTAEDVAFPELAKNEGSYTAALDTWGATISLTMQALVNDDLGEFNRMLNRAGAIAQRTIDAQVYSVVNSQTWTNNTTSSAAPLATAGNLDVARKAFEKKTGPSGTMLGLKPRFLLVPSALRTAALQLTTQLLPVQQGGTGMQSYNQQVITQGDIIPIVTPYLTEAGTAANSTYYLAGDPGLVDTVTVAYLQGMESPNVTEYDAGAIAARKWKIIMPFKVVLAATTVSGNQFIPGMQQATT